MSVHTIHTTHLDKIDMIAKSYLKKWLKIPSRGVTDLTFFHPRLLDIKPPSQLYLEGHAGNYVNNRLKGDRVVNAALDSALEREKQWSRKSSTIVKCDEIFQEVAETNHIPDPTNCVNVACSTSAPRTRHPARPAAGEPTLHHLGYNIAKQHTNLPKQTYDANCIS